MINISAEVGQDLSLLWPDGEPTESGWWIPEEVIRDLDLKAIVTAMDPRASHQEAIENVVYRLCIDPDVITYRQAVLADLLRYPTLADTLKSILPLLDELALFTYRRSAEETSLHEVTRRTGELKVLVDCIHSLDEAFQTVSEDLNSEGLEALRRYVDAFMADEGFQQMVEALPTVLADLRASASITIGVNLDEYLRPEEAVLLSVNEERFAESGLLDRLFGRGVAEGKGIAPLHTLPLVSEGPGMITGGGAPVPGPTKRAEPWMVPLFRDLSTVLEKVTKPIAKELQQYVHLSGRVLTALRPEIIFYVYAVDLIRKLKSLGLPVCCPAIALAEERVCESDEAYNVHLALHLGRQASDGDLSDRVVTNDVILGPRGRIVILTGPNQGGKTTYMQAVGQVHVFAQVGLFVPARRARISPVDGIYTHFPIEERLELGTGRFGDEARRIRAIFDHVTRHSLVLLNESLSTTNAGESLYLARDIVRVLRRIGLRAVFTTHLHQLAADVDELSQDTPGDSKVVSMVASYPEEREAQETPEGVDGRYSYRVVLSPPVGRSYAERIATRYGIGYEQLIELLQQRHVVDGQGDG